MTWNNVEERRRHDDGLLRETIVRLDAHETADALMFKQISGQLAEMKVSLSKLFDRFWLTAIGVIALLLAVSSYLYIESKHFFKFPGCNNRHRSIYYHSRRFTITRGKYKFIDRVWSRI